MKKGNRILSLLLVLIVIASNSAHIVYARSVSVKDLTGEVNISNYNLYRAQGIDDSKLIIENGNKTNKVLEIREQSHLYMKFDWEIDQSDMANAQQGSYFYFDLIDPTYIKFGGNTSGPMNDKDGDTIANYEIQTDGRLKVTFTKTGVDKGFNNGITGTFYASLQVIKANKNYKIYVDKQKTIDLEFKVANQIVNDKYVGTTKDTYRQQFIKNGFPNSSENNILWKMFVNLDQLKPLFEGGAMVNRENVIIEDKLVKGLTLDTSYVMFLNKLNVPYIDKNNGYTMTNPPRISNKDIKNLTLQFKDFEKIYPETTNGKKETYDEFKTRIRKLKRKKMAIAIYENPDEDHSTAILFVLGDSLNMINPSTGKTWLFEDALQNKISLDDYIDSLVDASEGSALTQQQADFMKRIYGTRGPTAGKAVGLDILFKTKVTKSGVYENKATMYWGENEEVSTSVQKSIWLSGGTAQGSSPVSVKVKKVWADGNENHANDKVTIWLYQNGKKTDKKLVLPKDGKLEGSFDNLFVYYNGKEIKYSVKEEDVDGYDSVVTETEKNKFTITNSKKTNTETTTTKQSTTVAPTTTVATTTKQSTTVAPTTTVATITKQSTTVAPTTTVATTTRQSTTVAPTTTVASSPITVTTLAKRHSTGLLPTTVQSTTRELVTSEVPTTTKAISTKQIVSTVNTEESEVPSSTQVKTGSDDINITEVPIVTVLKAKETVITKNATENEEIEEIRIALEDLPYAGNSDSPNQIIVVDKSGKELGKYTRTLVNHKYEWVGEDGLVLGAMNIAQTGDEFPVIPIVVLIIVSSIVIVLFTKIKISHKN